MGRRKLEIKRIEDKSSRQVTFSKRRNGLFKKAKELSVLCDLDIAAIIYSCRGKPYHFCSTNSLTEIVQRYHNRAETEAGCSSQVGESQAQYSKYSRFLNCQELLQIVERELDKPCVDDLSVTDFVHLEEQFETALLQTRATKTNLLLESLSSLQGKEKLLEEENKMLQEKICASKTKTAKKTLAFDLNALPGGETE
ncbi:agamous-like MADS-box protein AGL27 [Salvia splendens]|uniref:agamous-like MADS-box protein AGL27 n=1 Tax=Salvia splendens TaxID=180675 RepID=UPI001C27DD4B|nr:agamous-like MADS-box protein AGL27 [Salvia splendens]